MSEQSQFLFAVCQRGAEPALKSEVARMERGFRFAYSRPGFVTFRLPDDRVWGADLDFHSVFARAHGLTIGKVEGTDAGALAANVWTQLEDRQVRQLHVWQRDRGLPGDRGFQPGYGQAVDAAVPALQGCLPDGSSVNINQTARPGDEVFDCILVEPHVWWLGHHIARGSASRWPGGVYAESRPADAVSRAYIKTNEALTWSRISLSAGDRCVEIGSAPGGSSQALLEQGLQVIGIDPAEMDARVMQHPAFSHIRKRGADVRRREFRGVPWLMADANVAPAYALDTVEAIVTHPDVHIRGMLLTLKLLDWKLADQLPAYLQRIRSWGYQYVRARQLAHGRQEICVCALRQRSMRRPPRKQSRG